MAKTFKVPFAFNEDGTVIDIQTAEKQTIYKCSCGSDVKLRGGMVISDHFYHINDSECSLESSIHKAYKSVIQMTKRIKLPFPINGKDTLVFDRIELEKQIDDFIPDAIGYIGLDRYLIEFAKTSYIGERKLAKIKKSNLFCIEVSIIETVKTIEEIDNHIVNERYYKDIVHISEYREMTEMKDRFKKVYYDQVMKIKELTREINHIKSTIACQGPPREFNIPFKKVCKNGAEFYAGWVDNVNYILFVTSGEKATIKAEYENEKPDYVDESYNAMSPMELLQSMGAL
jgi:hypothetical protein